MQKLIILFLFSIAAQAMRLFPVPIEKQLKDSKAVMYGSFLGHSYKKMPSGKIVTEASFKIIKTAGISSRYMVNKNMFTIYYDGGLWQGLNYFNESAPHFKRNSNYIVLLKRDSFGFRPTMDKLGVYEVIQQRYGTVLQSAAFPSHPKIGLIEIDKFEISVKAVFGSYLQQFHSDRYVYEGKKTGILRQPASIEEEPKQIDKSRIGILWVVLIFGVLGAIRLRKYRRE